MPNGVAPKLQRGPLEENQIHPLARERVGQEFVELLVQFAGVSGKTPHDDPNIHIA